MSERHASGRNFGLILLLAHSHGFNIQFMDVSEMNACITTKKSVFMRIKM